MTVSQISESRQPSWRILEWRPGRRPLIYDSDRTRSATWTSLLLTDPFPDLVQRDHRECWIMFWYIFSDIFEVIRHIRTENLIHVAAMTKPVTEWVTGWSLKQFESLRLFILRTFRHSLGWKTLMNHLILCLSLKETELWQFLVMLPFCAILISSVASFCFIPQLT